MARKLEGAQKVNLDDAIVLLLEATQHAVDVLAQIVHGFGIREVIRCTSVEEAEKVVAVRAIDLFVVEPKLREGDGIDFIKALRASGNEPNCHAPVVVIHGHARRSDVARMRDSGANFVVTKPIRPHVLLERIMWVALDKRPFCKFGSYIGPDRRFKFEGPPAGSDGRRQADATVPISNVAGENLSQSDLAALIKPQRVSL